MTGTLTIKAEKATATFSHTAPVTVIQAVIDDCAEHLWINESDATGEVLNPFAKATNQEKLDVLNAHFESVMLNMANTHKSLKAQKEARKKEEVGKYSF